MRILIAEDDRVPRRVLRATLAQCRRPGCEPATGARETREGTRDPERGSG
jgi:hypothetical protein